MRILNDDAYLEDLEETIASCEEAGVKLINIVGFDDKSIEKHWKSQLNMTFYI